MICWARIWAKPPAPAMAILIMAGREVLCFIVNMGGVVASELVVTTAGLGVDISEVSHRKAGTKVRSKGLFI